MLTPSVPARTAEDKYESGDICCVPRFSQKQLGNTDGGLLHSTGRQSPPKITAKVTRESLKMKQLNIRQVNHLMSPQMSYLSLAEGKNNK